MLRRGGPLDSLIASEARHCARESLRVRVSPHAERDSGAGCSHANHAPHARDFARAVLRRFGSYARGNEPAQAGAGALVLAWAESARSVQLGLNGEMR